MSTITNALFNQASSNSYQLETLSSKPQATEEATPAQNLTTEDTIALSPAAQAYLDSLGSVAKNSLTERNTFTLTREQETTLNALLEKYADVAYTQENFDALQADMEAAGLSPERLAIEEEIRTFSSTEMFLNALNGDTGMPDLTGFSFDDYSDKMTAFMENVVSIWQGDEA